MPIGEFIGEVMGGLLRVAGRIAFEMVIELLIIGAGRVLIRLVRPKSDPDDFACGIVGIMFWAAMGAVIYAAFFA